MIQAYPTLAEALAQPDPKHVVFEGGEATVYTGDDIPAEFDPVIIVSAWALRRALNQSGLRQSIEDAIAASGDQDLIDGWAHAGEFHSNHPAMLALCAAIGIAREQVRQVFKLASMME